MQEINHSNFGGRRSSKSLQGETKACMASGGAYGTSRFASIIIDGVAIASEVCVNISIC